MPLCKAFNHTADGVSLGALYHLYRSVVSANLGADAVPLVSRKHRLIVVRQPIVFDSGVHTILNAVVALRESVVHVQRLLHCIARERVLAEVVFARKGSVLGMWRPSAFRLLADRLEYRDQKSVRPTLSQAWAAQSRFVHGADVYRSVGRSVGP